MFTHTLKQTLLQGFEGWVWCVFLFFVFFLGGGCSELKFILNKQKIIKKKNHIIETTQPTIVQKGVTTDYRKLH